MDKYIISACLLGLRTRYDGTDKNRKKIMKKYGMNLVPVCPEQLGGLSTPREPADIIITNKKKKLLTRKSKTDVTGNFKKGALETLMICKKLNIRKAILKSESPSCGIGGITYDLLKKNNIEIIIEN